MIHDIQIRSGVIGGTLFSTALNIGMNDLLFTAVMSMIGAVVSFFVSYILRKLFSDSDKSKNA
jgi:hydrogenase maturation factor HypE